MPQETRRLTHIQVGTRYRLHLGDIAALAESMQALGLLHPVVITPDNCLIAGARRLAAAKRLGWEEIAVHVVDVPSMLETEYDENVMRADFTLVEKVRLGMAIEHEIAARNAAKMREAGQQGGRGKKKENPMTKNHRVSEEKAPPLTTRAQIGRVIGLGGTA